jgi:hypothetical protein
MSSSKYGPFSRQDETGTQYLRHMSFFTSATVAGWIYEFFPAEPDQRIVPAVNKFL